MKENKQIKIGIIATLALFAITALLLYFFFNNNDTATEGSKNILIQVIIPDEDVKEFNISTDAETLREALDEIDLIKGDESTYGFFITEVNGRKVDSNKQEWWSLSKDGEFSMYGIDDINIQDKDQYELTLVEGYN